jgi:hypothetical protein
VHLAIAHRKDDIDGGFHFDRLIVEQIGAIAPAFNCVNGGLDQHGMTAQRTKIFNGARSGNCGGEDDRSRNACCSCDLRIARECPKDDHAFGHAAGNRNSLLLGRMDNWHRLGMEENACSYLGPVIGQVKPCRGRRWVNRNGGSVGWDNGRRDEGIAMK